MREVLSKTLTIKAVGDVRAIADTPISNSGDDGAQKRRVVLGGKIVVDMRRPPSLVCWKAAISAKHWCVLRGQRDIVQLVKATPMSDLIVLLHGAAISSLSWTPISASVEQ
jgi:hypothetical protein